MSVATSPAHPKVPHLTSRGEPSARPSVFPPVGYNEQRAPETAAEVAGCESWDMFRLEIYTCYTFRMEKIDREPSETIGNLLICDSVQGTGSNSRFEE